MAMIWNKNVMNQRDANVQPKSQSRLPGELSNRTSDHRQPNHFRVANFYELKPKQFLLKRTDT